MRVLVVAVTILSLVVPESCLACIWDTDTRAMELQRFPDAQELITGQFVRHSKAYYEWRISDRSAKPSDQRTPADFDDLAVAYEKLGQHDQAIETIQAKIARWPKQGRYESEANLGTFLLHAGRFEEGLGHIKAAIEMNPAAHFGREIYQQRLVEYVLKQRADHAQLPLNQDESDGPTGFAAFILAGTERNAEAETAEIQAAAKGIMGMMRFGHYDSPILLEALGDLLLSDGYRSTTRLLAARAYLKAAYECAVHEPLASVAYRQEAARAFVIQGGSEWSPFEAAFQEQIRQGTEFFGRIAKDEEAWIGSGKNLDREFAKKYYGLLSAQDREYYGVLQPKTDADPPLPVEGWTWAALTPLARSAWTLGCLSFLLLGIVLLVTRVSRRRHDSDGQKTTP